MNLEFHTRARSRERSAYTLKVARANPNHETGVTITAIRRPIRNYPIVAFTILACLFGWVSFIAYAFGAAITPDGMPLGPIVAAFIVAACLGRTEFKEWGRRLITFRTGIGWYALAFVAPIVIITIVALTNYALGTTLPSASQLAIWTELPGTFVFFLIFVGIGEEAGWTAFASPLLLRRHTFIKAWLILSAIRVLWHVPLMMSGNLPWVLGVGGNIAFQFLVLWLFQRADQRWFLAAIWHAVLNTSGGKFFFQLVQGNDEARLAMLMTAGYVIAAIAVFLFDRRGLEPIKEVNQRDR